MPVTKLVKSMGAADPNWVAAAKDRHVIEDLEDGITATVTFSPARASGSALFSDDYGGSGGPTQGGADDGLLPGGLTAEDEADRLHVLAELEVLDSAAEPEFDLLTELASRSLNTPIALVSLVDANRQWFKSKVGLELEQTPRSIAFCHHAIASDEVLVVPDARADSRFSDNPFVVGGPGIRFYAGAPISIAGHRRVGTLCVLDTEPRSAFGLAETLELKRLAERAALLLEMRKTRLETARKAAQGEELEDLLQVAEKSAGVGTWIYDVQSDQMRLSSEAAAILGLGAPVATLQGRSISNLYHAQDLERARALMLQALDQGSAVDDNIRVTWPDGSVRHVAARAYARKGECREVRFLYGSVVDVTNIRRNESLLIESQARYKAIADHINDIVIKYSLSGTIEYVSQSIERYGVSAEKLIGRNIWTTFPRTDALRPAMDAIERNEPVPGGRFNEWEHLTSSGGSIWLQSNPAPVYDRNGDVSGVVTVIRDVTERKKLEDELRQKSLQAQAAASAKAEFLANMSHEIRTPLTAVLGYAGLLRKQKDLSPKAQAYADRIDRSGEALLAIVNNILDFSKLEAGRIELKLDNIEPRQLLTAVQDIVHPTCDEKGLELILEIDEETPQMVLADGGRLRQVLLNLAGNAVKFTQSGRIGISMCVNCGGDRVRFEVSDTGPGIPDDVSHRLFERFSQVDMSLARQHEGTGLGLAISKSLVQLMDGAIGFRSQVGEGSTFWFEIPLLSAQVTANPTRPDVLIELPPRTRLLLVDDLAVNRELVLAMLGEFDLDIVEAANGLEAVEAAGTQTFDLVLMDLQMPRMDGLEATRAIRTTSPINASTPIIALSANVMESHVEACRAAGMNDHIAKPIQPIELITKLAAWANVSKGARTP